MLFMQNLQFVIIIEKKFRFQLGMLADIHYQHSVNDYDLLFDFTSIHNMYANLRKDIQFSKLHTGIMNVY